MEILTITPGDCYVKSSVDTDTGLTKHKFSFDSQVLAVPKEERIDFLFKTSDQLLREHMLALVYSYAVKEKMEEAMAFTFDKYCQIDVPAKAVVEVGKYWIH